MQLVGQLGVVTTAWRREEAVNRNAAHLSASFDRFTSGSGHSS
jgi:hypothetical protein